MPAARCYNRSLPLSWRLCGVRFATQRCLPMRLTVIEEFFYHANREAFPASCFLQLHCSGTIDAETLALAWDKSIEANPLLCSRVDGQRRLRWQRADVIPPITWLTSDSDAGSCSFQDLSVEMGLRLSVIPQPEESVEFASCPRYLLRIQFHHACCDGLGIFQFAAELLQNYAAIWSSAGATVPISTQGEKTADLSKRGKLVSGVLNVLRLIPRQLIGLRGVINFVRRQPVPVVTYPFRDYPPTVPSTFPAVCCERLSVEESNRLATAASDLGVSMNTLLARDLFVATDEFRESSSEYGKQQWVRMMIPISMRNRLHRHLTAANIVSSVFLDRRGVDCEDEQGLLQSVHDEMELIHRNQLGFIFLTSLAVCRWLPGGIRRSARQAKGDVSCVFTNVGRVFAKTKLPKQDGRLVVGDFIVENAEPLAPIQPGCCAVFSANRYAGRFSFALHFDPRALTKHQSESLLERFVTQVRKTLK
jgi:hypothetical protein